MAPRLQGLLLPLPRHGQRLRSGNSELSTVDTTLLLGGVLFAQSYFDRDEPREAEIRALAETIYRRVRVGLGAAASAAELDGLASGAGHAHNDWAGLQRGACSSTSSRSVSPTHPLDKARTTPGTSTYDRTWGTYYGQEHLSFPPLFGHQYSRVWVDFRGSGRLHAPPRHRLLREQPARDDCRSGLRDRQPAAGRATARTCGA
jgi:hypothetical protein